MKWQQETISLTQKTNTGFCPNWILQKIFLQLENFGVEVSIIYKNTKENRFCCTAEELYYNLAIQQISYTSGQFILSPNRTDENLVLILQNVQAVRMMWQLHWAIYSSPKGWALQERKNTVRKCHHILLFHQQQVNKWIHSI